jgi:YndJ-like protein
MTAVLDLVVTLGMLLVVPLGLRLIPGLPGWLPRAYVVGAFPGAVALWLPRGLTATSLSTVYAVTAVGLAALGLLRVATPTVRGLAALTATVSPCVAATALVAERAGYPLFGFPPRTLSLTVAHFHFAGFAAALVAGLVCASTSDSLGARWAALCVPGGIAVVFVGFFVGSAVQLVGAAVLTTGLWLAAFVIWRDVFPGVTDRATRLLLGTSAAVLVPSLLLALWWALGRTADLPHPSVDWMIATHGVANAVGFGLCSVLAWRRLLGRPAPVSGSGAGSRSRAERDGEVAWLS